MLSNLIVGPDPAEIQRAKGKPLGTGFVEEADDRRDAVAVTFPTQPTCWRSVT